jgi:hypothetical protein
LTKLRETGSATAKFERVSREYGMADEVLEGAAACLYAIPQENDIDTTDRVDAGAPLLRDLVEAGL